MSLELVRQTVRAGYNLCSKNDLYSPMAEALLDKLDSQHFDVMSDGIDRGEMHPIMVEVMKDIGIDLQSRVSKTTQAVLDRSFDFVITLCDRARLECPKFEGAELVHWRFDDPLTASDRTRRKRMVQSLRDQIAQRVRLFALVQVRFAMADSALRHDSVLSA
jgi:protein-tyrosine-phosphatase